MTHSPLPDVPLPLPAPPAGFRGPFRTDADARAVYSESAGILRIVPRGIARPADADDIVTLVRWGAAHGIPLITRGSGSSMSGGAVGDGVIVDLSALDDISPVDAEYARLSVAPGALRRQVERAARGAGLRFPVDPSSGAFATIGGMAACNAAGPRTMRFGAMRRWVHALDCVFADGSRATVRRGETLPGGSAVLERWRRRAASIAERAAALPARRVRKDSSGYGVTECAATGELVDLLVGSEGTLAIFAGVEILLAPLPGSTVSVRTSWRTLEGAVRGAALAREGGAVACELLDRTFLDVARGGNGGAGAIALPVPSDSEAVLLIELEGGDGVVAQGEALARACERAGATSAVIGADPESAEALWELRHAASPILARLDPHLKSMQLIEDGCVPPHRLGDYVLGVRRLLDEAELRGVIFGHAGDAHVHVNALVDVRSPDWRERTERLFHAVVALTASLGGTLAGEHGDGRLRTPVAAAHWSPDALALFAEIKEIFDPGALLNPGVKVGAAGAVPLAANKYDPALPPLPDRARKVLERVERERAYDRSRLDLLHEVE